MTRNRLSIPVLSILNLILRIISKVHQNIASPRRKNVELDSLRVFCFDSWLCSPLTSVKVNFDDFEQNEIAVA